MTSARVRTPSIVPGHPRGRGGVHEKVAVWLHFRHRPLLIRGPRHRLVRGQGSPLRAARRAGFPQFPQAGVEPLAAGPLGLDLGLCPFAGIGRPSKTPIFVTAVTIGTYSDPPVPLRMRPLLGTILAERGLIDPERLAEALAEAQATNQRVGEVLLRRGWIYEQELARALAHQYELEYVDLETACLNPRDAALLDPEVGVAAPSRSASPATSSSSRSPTPRRTSSTRCARAFRTRCDSSSPSRRSSSTSGTSSSPVAVATKGRGEPAAASAGPMREDPRGPRNPARQEPSGAERTSRRVMNRPSHSLRSVEGG